MLRTGQRAPGVSFQSIDGDSVALSGILQAGRALLAFYKASCPVCQLALPFLDRLHNGGMSGGRVFAVSQDDAGESAGFRRHFGLRMPVLLDDAGAGYQASNGFDIAYVPSMFLVEQDGRISWTSEGFVRQELEDLGRLVAAEIFRRDESVPAWKAG